MEILINGFDFWNMEAMHYYSFTSSYSGDKKAKAMELCLSERYWGSRKMDGQWNMIIKDMNGELHMRSRKEGVSGGFVDKIDWVPQIKESINDIPNGSAIVGEIYFPDDEGSRKITSVLNCLKDKCLDRQKKKPLHFYAFDILACDGELFIEKPIIERIKYLEKLKNHDYIETAIYLRGQALWDLFGEVIAAEGEGIVITREDCHYLPGKKTAWMTLKMKRELADTVDAFIDGHYKPAKRLYGGKEIQSWSYWENVKTGEKYNTCKFDDYINGVPVEAITAIFLCKSKIDISP